jgi:hypothetical protein
MRPPGSQPGNIRCRVIGSVSCWFAKAVPLLKSVIITCPPSGPFPAVCSIPALLSLSMPILTSASGRTVRQMLWKRAVAFLAVLLAGREALADRPSNESICDYYAAQRYGASNSTTQLRLMQGIVAYAYAGGNTPNSTGIFNHGQFDGHDVYLRPWFDGSSMAAPSQTGTVCSQTIPD